MIDQRYEWAIKYECCCCKKTYSENYYQDQDSGKPVDINVLNVNNYYVSTNYEPLKFCPEVKCQKLKILL